MTDRDALLDLQARWAAVGVDCWIANDNLWVGVSKNRDPSAFVGARNDWSLSPVHLTPAALRVFADWIQEGEATA